MLAAWRREAVFGAMDGLGLILGILAGLIVAHQPQSAVWTAAVSGGIAELISMANAQRVADKGSGLTAALVIGLATFAGCVLPAVPYSVLRGPAALILALVLAALAAGVISWLRPEKGVLAVVETYMLLTITGAACGIAGLWL